MFYLRNIWHQCEYPAKVFFTN